MTPNFGKSKTYRMAGAITKFIEEDLAEGGPSKSSDLLAEFLESATAAQLEVLFDIVISKVTYNDL
jgi:hypothetical protein